MSCSMPARAALCYFSANEFSMRHLDEAQHGEIAFLQRGHFHTAQHAVLLSIEPGSAVYVLLGAFLRFACVFRGAL